MNIQSRVYFSSQASAYKKRQVLSRPPFPIFLSPFSVPFLAAVYLFAVTSSFYFYYACLTPSYNSNSFFRTLFPCHLPFLFLFFLLGFLLHLLPTLLALKVQAGLDREEPSWARGGATCSPLGYSEPDAEGSGCLSLAGAKVPMAFLLEARILTDNLDLVRLEAVGKLSPFLLPLSSSLFCIFHSCISLHIVFFFLFVA